MYMYVYRSIFIVDSRADDSFALETNEIGTLKSSYVTVIIDSSFHFFVPASPIDHILTLRLTFDIETASSSFPSS